MAGTFLPHHGKDRGGHHVSRLELVGKALASGVKQHRALSARRLGYEKGPTGATGIKTCRMNLHIVHMLELYAAIARYTARIPSDLGVIGRVLVQAAYSARSEDNERRPDDGTHAVFAFDHHAGACTVLLDKVDHARMLANFSVISWPVVSAW